MNGVSVSSYVRVSREKFIPIERVALTDIKDYYVGGGSTIAPGNYIPGAIRIEIYGQPLTTFEMWDDVNFLWEAVIAGLSDCLGTGHGKSDFPSQSLTINMERIVSLIC